MGLTNLVTFKAADKYVNLSKDQAFSWIVISISFLLCNKSSQSNLERAHNSRTTTQQSPHWFQWDTTNSPPKLPLHFWRSSHPSNIPIPQPIPLTAPNCIQIHSAVLPQYTFQTQTDRETDKETERQTDDKWQVYSNSTHTLLIVSDALKISNLQQNIPIKVPPPTVARPIKA